MEGGALVGKLLTVEPLGDQVDTTAARLIARRVRLFAPQSELLIDGDSGAPLPADPRF